MLNVKLEIAETLIVNSRGREVELDLTKLPANVIAYAALHGLKQKVGDSAASAASVACGIKWETMSRAEKKEWVEGHAAKVADTAEDMMKGIIARLEAGEWEAPRQSVTRTAANPIEALAMKNAKAALTAIFQAVTGKKKMADMADHEKVAPFFGEGSNGVVWNDESVMKFIAKQAESGKRDFMGEAKATLEGADDVAGELDI